MRFTHATLGYSGIAITLLVAVISISASNHWTDTSIHRSIKHNGIARSYLVHVPDAVFDDETHPLLIALHEDGGSARSLLRLTQGEFNEMANEHGYLVVYPEALKKQWSKDLKVEGENQEVDDVGFISMLIKSLAKEHNIDTNRIFITGMSSGGLMAFRLACELPGVFRAIAPIAVTMPDPYASSCHNVDGTSLLLMNGTEDPIVPYTGGAYNGTQRNRLEMLSPEQTVVHWLNKNGCPSHAKEELLPDLDRKDGTTVVRYDYSGCGDGVNVRRYQINGGGHAWPGGRQASREDRIGRASRDVDASERIWAFFDQF